MADAPTKPISFKFILLELQDPEKMLKWCMDVGLIGDKYICNKCGSIMKLSKRNDKYSWRCRENRHDVSRSLRKDTWFENSKMTVSDILLVTHMWCMNASHNCIKREVELANNTVGDWRNLCREVCVEICMLENEMLGGPGVIVDLDVGRFEKSKFQRRRRVDGKWVYGGIERGTNKCFFCVVGRRDKEELLEVIEKNVLAGTTVMSDCWRSYDILNDEDFQMLANKLAITFQSSESGEESENTWAAVKKSLGTKCTVGDDNFNSHVFEDMWRKKHAKDPDLTRSFLEAIKKVYPLMSYN